MSDHDHGGENGHVLHLDVGVSGHVLHLDGGGNGHVLHLDDGSDYDHGGENGHVLHHDVGVSGQNLGNRLGFHSSALNWLQRLALKLPGPLYYNLQYFVMEEPQCEDTAAELGWEDVQDIVEIAASDPLEDFQN